MAWTAVKIKAADVRVDSCQLFHPIMLILVRNLPLLAGEAPAGEDPERSSSPTAIWAVFSVRIMIFHILVMAERFHTGILLR